MENGRKIDSIMSSKIGVVVDTKIEAIKSELKKLYLDFEKTIDFEVIKESIEDLKSAGFFNLLKFNKKDYVNIYFLQYLRKEEKGSKMIEVANDIYKIKTVKVDFGQIHKDRVKLHQTFDKLTIETYNKTIDFKGNFLEAFEFDKLVGAISLNFKANKFARFETLQDSKYKDIKHLFIRYYSIKVDGDYSKSRPIGSLLV